MGLLDGRGFRCSGSEPQHGDNEQAVHEGGCHRWKSPGAHSERCTLVRSEDTPCLAGGRPGADHPSRFNPRTDRFAGLEERAARKGLDRSRDYNGINRVAGDPGSSCDLFDSEDVSENRHRGVKQARQISCLAV